MDLSSLVGLSVVKL